MQNEKHNGPHDPQLQVPLNLIPIVGDLNGPPPRPDIERHRTVLLAMMEAFPLKAPNGSDIAKAFVALDNFFWNKLSKTLVRKSQKAWANLDAAPLHWMLQHVFERARTQGGSTAARYPALAELKACVKTDAAMRRSEFAHEDLHSIPSDRS